MQQTAMGDRMLRECKAMLRHALADGKKVDVQARLAAQQQTLQARFAEQEAQTRIQLTTRLAQLQQQIDSSSNPEELRKQLAELQQELLGMEGSKGQAPFSPDSDG